MSQSNDKKIRREARQKAGIMATDGRFGRPNFELTPVDPAAFRQDYWNPLRVKAFFKGVRYFKKMAKK